MDQCCFALMQKCFNKDNREKVSSCSSSFKRVPFPHGVFTERRHFAFKGSNSGGQTLAPEAKKPGAKFFGSTLLELRKIL